MPRLTDIVRTKFTGRKIVILGDVVADQFLHGTISRVSREAPVFILDHDNTETRAGGGANAAVNVASLGGEPVLVGFIGDDQNGERLRETLQASGVGCGALVVTGKLQTTTKVRVLAGQHYAPRQQVIRIDYATRNAVDAELMQQLTASFEVACDGADAIIISDYNYGAADPGIAEHARRVSAKTRIPLLIDSRFRLAEFPSATAATPNQEEVEQILGKGFTAEACSELRERLGYDALLVTRGNKGMTLFEKSKPPHDLEAVGAKEPIDVTGAGDTVIGTFALGLASGLSFVEAATVANHAGGIVVMKRGTASVTVDELVESLESHTPILGQASPAK